MRNVKLFITVILFSLIMAACANSPEEPTTVPQISQPVGIVAEGRVFPINYLDQSFTMNGLVEEVLVQEGESVTAGQVLVRLSEAPEIALQLARAEQELLAARQAREELLALSPVVLAEKKAAALNAQDARDLAREKYAGDPSDDNLIALELAEVKFNFADDTISKLTASDGVDTSQLELIDARIISAEAALATAQSLIDARELKASISGMVTNLNLQPGEVVTGSKPVLTIADTSSWVVLTDNLTEMEVPLLKVGQKVEVSLDALPDNPVVGEITKIDSRYEEKRGDITYTITIHLESSLEGLRWGMTAAVVFVP